MDGYEVLRKIRQKSQIPVIIVSARQEDVDLILGFGTGADDYVTKPFSPSVLVARIRAHLRRKEDSLGDESSYYVFGSFKLDMNRQILTQDEKTVNLSPREMDLLIFLIKKSGVAVSQEELFHSVWGNDFGDMSTVSVHIRRLRSKLGEDSANPPLYKNPIWLWIFFSGRSDKLKHNHQSLMSWRMIILNLILPINLIILLFIFFIQIWYLQFNIDEQGLQSKRFLVEPLLEVVSDKANNEKRIPSWLTSVVLEDGHVLYPFTNTHLLQPETYPEGLNIRDYFVSLIKAIESDISIVSFTYKGQKGICTFDMDLLPNHYKMLQKPKYLFNLFIVTTLFFLLGAAIIYNLKRDMMELIKASNRLKNMDFDTPLVAKKENELFSVFNAFEEMRQELNNTRHQGLNFMMSVTHDLKTPLTSIRGYLEAFRDGLVESPEDAMNVINILLNKAGMLEERLDEMLDFSRIISTQTNTIDELFSVKEWMEELIQYFKEESLLYKKDFSYHEDFPVNLMISGSQTRLSRAVINLYDNACKHTGIDDSIRFSAEYDALQSLIVIRMDDNGPGVPVEDQKRIFELFFKKDHGRNTRGMGIGLSSVKFVAEVHRGTVQCRESDLGGARFELSLPVLSDKS